MATSVNSIASAYLYLSRAFLVRVSFFQAIFGNQVEFFEIRKTFSFFFDFHSFVSLFFLVY